MKKIFLFLTVLLPALAAVSCGSDDAETTQGSYNIRLKGNSGAATRTGFGEADGQSVLLLWSAGDMVWVGTTQSLPITEGGATADFELTNLPSNPPFTVIYNMTGTQGATASIPAAQRQASPWAVELGENGDFGYGDSDREGNFTLTHLTSYVWFSPYSMDITDNNLMSITLSTEDTPVAGTAAFASGSLGECTGNASVTLTLGEEGFALPAASDPSKVFAAMVLYPADLTGKDVEITYTFADGNSFTETKAGRKLMPGGTLRVETGITLAAIIPQTLYSTDGGTTWETTLPASFTTLSVKTANNASLSDDDYTAIIAAMQQGASLDLSDARHNSDSFGIYFTKNTKLKWISLPYNIKTLEGKREGWVYAAFNDCSALETVILPEGLETLGSHVFYNCGALTEVYIPQSVTAMGINTFDGCKSLVSIDLPDNLSALKYETFLRCTSLRSVHMPANLINIENNAFMHCSSLEEIEIPAGVKTLTGGGYNTGMFYQCTGLKKVIFNEGLENIGNNVFHECKGLLSLDLPQSLQTLGEYSFYGCISLTEVHVNVATIPAYCFMYPGYDNGMAKITLGENVQSLKTRAFSQLRNVSEIHFLSQVPPTPQYASGSMFPFANVGETVTGDKYIYVPAGTEETYKQTYKELIDVNGFKIYGEAEEPQLPDGVYFSATAVNDSWVADDPSSFDGQAYLYVKTVGAAKLNAGHLATLKDFIMNNSGQVFLDMQQAEYENASFPADFPNGNFGTAKITGIAMPWNIEVIGRQTCAYCDNLTTVILGEHVTDIYDYCFTPMMGVGVTEIVCKAATPPTLHLDGQWGVPFESYSTRNGTVSVPAASIGAYGAAPIWSDKLVGQWNFTIWAITE